MKNPVSVLVVLGCFSFFNSYGPSNLHEAIAENDFIAAQKYLDRDINRHSRSFCFPLTYAVIYKNAQMVEFLLKNGAKLDTCPELTEVLERGRNGFHFSPMYYAIRDNQLEIVRILCKYGYDVTKEMNGTQFTYPIIAAAKFNVNEIFKILLNKGVDVLVKDFNGENALMFSASAKNIDFTKTLLQKGSQVNDTSNFGYTPLMYTAENQGVNNEIVSLLINNGADLNYTNKKNQSAFSLSCLYNNRDLALYLFDHGAIGKDSQSEFEANARTNHFLGDAYFAKDDLNKTKGHYIKAKENYSVCIAEGKKELAKINSRKAGNFALRVLAGSISQMQAREQAKQYGEALGMNNSQISTLTMLNADRNRMIYSPIYKKNPVLLYDYRLPANASLDEQKAFYKNKIKQVEMSIRLIDGIITCIDKGLTGEELNVCVQNIQL